MSDREGYTADGSSYVTILMRIIGSLEESGRTKFVFAKHDFMFNSLLYFVAI